ncbi:IS66 family transposase [Chitinophaga sp. GbtcB8]|uniref:IS66 family transposase n=1 Tax=Chitinophaga sp. GbtcB8 TaxID=2824753 RepID=UPI001C307264|nr:IS66 family transposase [Chitinophaga sp. GbtcB8]
MISNSTDIDYKRLYESSQKDNEQLAFRLTQLQHELAQLKKLIFGSRQERFVPAANSNQLTLGIAAENVAVCQVTAAKKVEYTRTKVQTSPVSHPGRNKLPEHLRREEIILEPEHVPQGSKKIGEEITEQLECIPAELYVKQYIRSKYLAPTAKDCVESKIIIADLPVQPIDKCMAGPGLLAQLVIDKYCDHLPLHRQMQRFERAAVKLPYSTLTEWVSNTCKLIAPLYDALRAEVLQSSYLRADETPVPVLDKDKKGKTHQGYFWLYQDAIKKLVIFDYQEGRNKEGPTAMLAEFTGYLQTDGYEVYAGIAEQNGITLIHCMAHARRYFVEALDNDRQRAEYVLEQIQLLYTIEHDCTQRALSFDERKALRLQKATPILEGLGKWMQQQYVLVLPKSPIGKALAYSIKRWDKLSAYTKNGILSIDNNLAENSIRPVAIGRKNSLFCGSHEAAKRSAMLYSLMGTCKMHGVNPYTWLKEILIRIPQHPINKIKDLLPHNWTPA